MSSIKTVRRLHTLKTPEDLPLTLEIAPVGSRIAAFIFDTLLMSLLTFLIAGLLYLGVYSAGLVTVRLLSALCILTIFVIWNGYFLFFELFWRGATPGKRAVGLMVISRSGGPLTTSAVVARNLLRELETYLPLKVLLLPELMGGGVPNWAVYLSCAWLGVFLLMPLLNSDRARCGDLAGGTLVVVKPEVRLMPDPAEDKASIPGGYEFAGKQLDMYGIKELQVLEDVLRYDLRDRNRRNLLRLICDKITKKIAWAKDIPDEEVVPFLQAFYRAQRNRLEQQLLMGKRRKSKKMGRLKPE